MKSVKITVTPAGKVTIEASGFTGSSCEKATASLEAALGVVKEKEEKPEYYQTESGQVEVSQ